jgi:pyruvate formate lyase activating enzyme
VEPAEIVAAAQEDLRNIFVTHGYLTEEALGEANVDLKSFSPEFYRKFCGASLQPVLDTIARMWEAGIWAEVGSDPAAR